VGEQRTARGADWAAGVVEHDDHDADAPGGTAAGGLSRSRRHCAEAACGSANGRARSRLSRKQSRAWVSSSKPQLCWGNSDRDRLLSGARGLMSLWVGDTGATQTGSCPLQRASAYAGGVAWRPASRSRHGHIAAPVVRARWWRTAGSRPEIQRRSSGHPRASWGIPTVVPRVRGPFRPACWWA